LSKPYVYAEDSALLGNYLSEINSSGNLLEIGTGGGVNLQCLADKKQFDMIIGTDIANLADARKELTRDVELVQTDRAHCFRRNTFDLIITNPPYVPTPDICDISIDGCTGGMEVPLAFLTSALKVMKKQATVVMLLSSEDSLQELFRYCAENKLDCRKIRERRLFFEVLYLFEIKNPQASE